ncbi:UNVERIFIED_CONTAM: F-box/WD-40 repeat-containing protein [Sesamum calycinum]|uniref:F-box/WD-40 repeat-containing protein n=1 Tax=Sesamum calycinum TaxID=2727403 RepID=A0AAW2J1M7_9LAMI
MLHGFGSNLFSVAIGFDRIVCGGEEGVIRIWNFSQALEIEQRVRSLRGIRLENRMRRRKLQTEMSAKGGQGGQCSVAAKKNQMNSDKNSWHNKRRTEGDEEREAGSFLWADQGALLVEAHSDVALADLGDLSVPNPAWIKLIYRFPNEEEYKVVDMPLVIAQFLSAWAETAKAGSLVVNPKPCWDREIFLPRDPPKIAFSHTEFKRIDEGSTLTMNLWQGKPVQKCYRISREFQAHLKKAVQTYGEFSCTTFDAMAAHVWRSWVKALDVKPLDYELRLTFSVNARAKLKNPRLNDGFYGNALCVACTTSTVSRLIDGCLAETVHLVHEARLGVSEDYLRSTIDYIDLHRPKRLEFGGKLTVTQWTRFAIYESADFGWGKPIYAGPIDLTPTPQVCVFLPEGGETEASGAMVLCICLPECACHRFRELLLSHGFK